MFSNAVLYDWRIGRKVYECKGGMLSLKDVTDLKSDSDGTLVAGIARTRFASAAISAWVCLPHSSPPI